MSSAYCDEPHNSETPIHDSPACIEAWGRRGMFLGANFGFILGAIFVAIPFTAELPSYGLLGTLLVGVVACAVMAGAFAGLAAALYSKTSFPAFARVRTDYHGAP